MAAPGGDAPAVVDRLVTGRIALLAVFIALSAALILGGRAARASDSSWTSEAPIEQPTSDSSWTS